MKKFLRDLADLKYILLLALILRLVLAPLSFHSDLNNNAIWGIYAQEFGLRGFYDWLNFGNYARPDYPPLAIIMFMFIRIIWQYLFNFFWFINVKLPLFPSAFIPWFETKGFLMLIKFPGMFCDLAIGYLLYKITKSRLNMKFFLFNPAMIYLSASWGQLDSIVSFLGLLAVALTLQTKYLSAVTSYFVSVMIKVTMAPVAPILVLQSLKNKIAINKIFSIILLVVVYMFLIGFVFIDSNYIIWLTKTYWIKFVPGAVTLPYINLNAFNFWGVFYGLERYKDENLLFGLSLFRWGWVIFLFIYSKIVYEFIKRKDIYFAAFMFFFAAFIFMPRVHERYLYPVFVFAPILIKQKVLSKNIYYLMSTIFLINLYHWWWFPEIGFLIRILENNLVERLFSLANVLIFIYVFKKYIQKA